MDLTNFKILSFDCYGTLIDWERGLIEVLGPWLASHHLKLSNNEILEIFAKFETIVQSEKPPWKYPMILQEVASRIGRELGIESDEKIKSKLAQSIGSWPAFEDTKTSLNELGKTFKLVILSNIDEQSFQQTNINQLNMKFFKVYTAQRIGTYKPDLNNFNFMIKELKKSSIEKNEILHVAQSLYHDIEPALSLGLKTAWINRRKSNPGFGATPPSSQAVKPNLEFASLYEFVQFIASKTKLLKNLRF